MVVDTPPGFTPEVIAAIDSSTDSAWSAMLDSLSLKNTKLGLETLDLMGYDREPDQLVLNRADSRVGITHDDVTAILGRAPDDPRPERPRRPALGQRGRADRHCQDALRGGARVQALAASYLRHGRPTAANGDGLATGARPCGALREGRLMELHERLATTRPAARPAARPFADLKNRVHHAVITELGPQLFNANIDPLALRERVTRGHPRRSSTQRRASRARTASGWSTEIADDILGHGPLERLLADDSVTEVMVNGPDDIWVERQGRLYETSVRVQRRVAPAPDHQQDRRAGRPPESTSRRRWSTPGCRTEAASTRSSRRSRCRARW